MAVWKVLVKSTDNRRNPLFVRSALLMKYLNRAGAITVKESQSLIRQVCTSDVPYLSMTSCGRVNSGRNPLFVRSALLMLVWKGALYLVWYGGRNPLFVRSALLIALSVERGVSTSTWVAIPYSSGLHF